MFGQYMFSIILGKFQPFDFHPIYFNAFRIYLANNKPTRKSGGGRQEGNANNKPTRKSGGGRQEFRRECQQQAYEEENYKENIKQNKQYIWQRKKICLFLIKVSELLKCL
jgi:hypothetical protein